MKLFLVLALLLVGYVSASFNVTLHATVDYKNCAPDSTLHISSVIANVWPPVKGNDLQLTLNGNTDVTVLAGTYSFYTNYNGIKITESQGQFCDDITKCPMTGVVAITSTASIPSFLPSGAYTSHMSATDSDSGLVIYCVEVDFNL